MANEISAAFNQGLLEWPDWLTEFVFGSTPLVRFHFTAPRDAQNVEIKFFEVDSWISDGKSITESTSPPRLMGTTRGVIAGTKYKQLSQVIQIPPHKQLLTVDIDGSLITMAIPNPNNDMELDFVEVTFTVSAVVNGAQRTYRSPSPLFVRSTPTPRAELAIIAGDGKEFPNDPTASRYFAEAKKYWKSVQDNQLTTRISLESIFAFLKEDDESSVKARNSLPWGRINIVSHGDDGWNEQTCGFTAKWYIREGDNDDIKHKFGFTTARLLALGTPMNPGPGAPPARKEVDEHTEIIIRGCLIGNDEGLLNAIRDKFGTLATVYAPKYETIYRIENGVSRERLYETWDFSLPGNVTFPDQSRIAALLKARYARQDWPIESAMFNHPLYGFYTAGDWNAVAGIRSEAPGDQYRQRQLDTSSLEAYFSEDEVKNEVTRLDPKTGKLTTVKQYKSQAELTSLMSDKFPDVQFDLYAWTWKIISPSATASDFAVSGIGTYTIFQIFRILTTEGKGQGVAITPNYKDGAQFGRSS